MKKIPLCNGAAASYGSATQRNAEWNDVNFWSYFFSKQQTETGCSTHDHAFFANKWNAVQCLIVRFKRAISLQVIIKFVFDEFLFVPNRILARSKFHYGGSNQIITLTADKKWTLTFFMCLLNKIRSKFSQMPGLRQDNQSTTFKLKEKIYINKRIKIYVSQLNQMHIWSIFLLNFGDV